MTATPTTQRLQAIQRHTGHGGSDHKQVGSLVLVLPTGARVTSFSSTNSHGSDTTHLLLNSIPISSYRRPNIPPVALDISSVGTKFEGITDHLPRYNVLEILPPQVGHLSHGKKNIIQVPDIWTTIYTLFTLYPDQEHIPVIWGESLVNKVEVKEYLLTTGLGRLSVAQREQPHARDIVYLSRAAFWQGAGIKGYHHLGWLQWQMPNLPHIPAFTRNELVIAAHPLRPVKPYPGQVLYRRWCATVGQTLEFIYFDLDGVTDGAPPERGEDGILLSKHLSAFHSWHNDDRVNNAWGEKGNLKAHKEYIEGLLKGPGVLPCLMAWDGDLMGYTEVVWIKENHVAQHFSNGLAAGDWDRGIHVLVGESKYLGGGRSECWLRGLAHYSFLSDPRTQMVVGEPKVSNTAIVKAANAAGYHPHTTFDFPYKRSVLVVNSRERFFASNRSHI